MGGVDFVILALGAVGVLYGLSRGALRMITSVVSLVAAIYLASLYYSAAGRIAERELSVSPAIGTTVGYIAVFAIGFAAVEIAGGMAARVLSIVRLGWLDRIVGAMLGLGIAEALAGLLLMLLTAILPAGAAFLSQSELAPHVLGYAGAMIAYVPTELRAAYERKRTELYRYWLEREAGIPEARPSASPAK